MDIGSEGVLDALTQFREAVVEHAEHEETEEFDKLKRELDADELQADGGAVRAAEAIAPTRPHPGVESAKAELRGRARSRPCSTAPATRSPTRMR